MLKSGICVALASSFLFAAVSADVAFAQVRGPSASKQATAEPAVRIRNDGSGTVDLRNGCVVAYNWFGTRISGTRVCTPAMRAQADRIFRART